MSVITYIVILFVTDEATIKAKRFTMYMYFKRFLRYIVFTVYSFVVSPSW